TVEHVHVRAGGQARVGTVAQGVGCYRNRRANPPHQPSFMNQSTRAIAPSLAPVQTLSFALVLGPPAIIPQGGPHRTGTILALPYICGSIFGAGTLGCGTIVAYTKPN